ncbi:MAG: lipoyl(octanoyl) transferase LipB [Chloroflexi bacterium]|nr:MAG: lipoyl(octanoyl) transferase LipB [Chloroflexota bacterium]
MTLCEVWHIDCMAYDEALTLQSQLVAQRSQNASPDRLLLLEHPHTYTLGSSGKEAHLLLTPEERQKRGVSVFQVDRGGDITYHGPGQLVGYPIIRLVRGENLRADVLGYLRNLEEVIIQTLADFEIQGYRIKGLTGVWVDSPRGPEKICAIGVMVNARMVTKHGFALNINTDLSYFEGIIPCGIRDKGVTSMARVLGEPVDRGAVETAVARHFGQILDFQMRPAKPILPTLQDGKEAS